MSEAPPPSGTTPPALLSERSATVSSEDRNRILIAVGERSWSGGIVGPAQI